MNLHVRVIDYINHMKLWLKIVVWYLIPIIYAFSELWFVRRLPTFLIIWTLFGIPFLAVKWVKGDDYDNKSLSEKFISWMIWMTVSGVIIGLMMFFGSIATEVSQFSDSTSWFNVTATLSTLLILVGSTAFLQDANKNSNTN